MLNILLSSKNTIFEVTTRKFSAKGREKQVSAELHTKVKRELGVGTVAKEQSAYLSIAAQAAFSSLNKLDWLHSFHGEVNLKSKSNSALSFTLESSSAGLGYALALALEWRKQLNKPNNYTVEVFATGEIHSSGAVTSIGHLETKITAACNFMENRNEVTQTTETPVTFPKGIAPFVIFYPISNQDIVTPALEQRVEALNGKLYPVDRLQKALAKLLGGAYDGESDGGWEPFKGLLSFDYQDSLRFFGRERALSKLSKEFNEVHGLKVVTGVSGSGKSSLIKASLIPLINQELNEGNTFDWLVTSPKAHDSVESLLLALLNKLDEHWVISDKIDGDINLLLTDATQSPQPLIDAIKQAQLAHPTKRVLLYVDQFEEVFYHQKITREKAQQLTPLLAQLAQQVHNLDIVLSIRSEYEDILGKYGHVSHVDSKLTPDEWRDIVYKQATSFGLDYEPGLENLIVTEASDIPNALPALEYLLEQLYKKAKKEDKNARVLTHEHYKQLKGIRGVIAARAEEAIATHLDQANTFFEYFVGLNNEGSPYTKSVSLSLIEKENPSLYNLIQAFIVEQLVINCSSHQNQRQEKRVKLAHDTLLNFEEEESSWLRLKDWLVKNHDYLVWFKQIASSLQRWGSLQTSTDDKTEFKNNKTLSQEFLLNKLDLAQAQEIQQKSLINNPQVVSYIQTSQQYYQEQLELEAIRLRKDKRKGCAIIIFIIILLFISLVGWLLADFNEEAAIHNAEIANEKNEKYEQQLKEFMGTTWFIYVSKMIADEDLDIERANNLLRKIEQIDEETDDEKLRVSELLSDYISLAGFTEATRSELKLSGPLGVALKDFYISILSTNGEYSLQGLYIAPLTYIYTWNKQESSQFYNLLNILSSERIPKVFKRFQQGVVNSKQKKQLEYVLCFFEFLKEPTLESLEKLSSTQYFNKSFFAPDGTTKVDSFLHHILSYEEFHAYVLAQKNISKNRKIEISKNMVVRLGSIATLLYQHSRNNNTYTDKEKDRIEELYHYGIYSIKHSGDLNSPFYIRKKGIEHLRKFEFEKAKAQFNKILLIQNNNYFVKEKLLEISILQEECSNECKMLAKMIEYYPERSYTLSNYELLVSIINKEKNIDSIKVDFLLCWDLQYFISLYLKYKYSQGEFYQNFSNLDGELDIVNTCKSRDEILGSIGWILMLDGYYDKAFKFTSAAFNREPNGAWSMNMGHLYLFKGDNKKAYEYYEKAKNLFNNSSFKSENNPINDFDIFIQKGWYIKESLKAKGWFTRNLKIKGIK